MKSNIFILIIFLLAINGCKKEAKEPLIVTAEAYALPASVPYGGSTTLYWNSTNVTSVTKNGIPLSTTSGSEDLTSLIKDTSFTLKFKGLDGKIVTKSVLIPVAVKPIDPRTDLLCSKNYKIVETKFWDNNDWSYLILAEQQLRIKEYYYTDGTTKSFDPIDNKLIGSCNWSFISKDSILIGDQRYQYTLTDSTFILSSRKGILIDKYRVFSK